MTRFPKSVFRSIYLVIILGAIRRIFRKCHAVTESHTGCYWPDPNTPPLPNRCPDTLVIDTVMSDATTKYVAGVVYSGQYWWFDEGGRYIDQFKRTDTGYWNGSADLPPGTWLVPVNLEYPGAIRACKQAMNHIHAPG